MKIYDLKTRYQTSPLGIDLTDLTFSWKVKDTAGTAAEKIRVRIAPDPSMQDCCYDSGEVPCALSHYSPDVSLLPGQPYYWQVEVTDNAGEHAVSAPAYFEGGHPEGEWIGHWIKAPFVQELYPVFQKDFELPLTPEGKNARLYICGLGLYEVYLNGEKVGDQYLSPYFTDYRYHVQYQTYDVSGLLKSGENRINVYLGNGWYKGKFGYSNHAELQNYYGSEFILLADLYVTDAGSAPGTAPSWSLGTDESWYALKSPVITSGIYEGELYDVRMEADILNPPAQKKIHAVKANAPAGDLIPMTGLPVKKQKVLKVQEVITTRLGETVLDFGQEITGWVTFWADAPLKQQITLQHGEILQDGVFYRDNLRAAKAEFSVISGGERCFVRPHFTFFGFRYVKVTGMTVDDSNRDDFEAWALYSDLEETGFLDTSNEKVNRLIENTKWSQRDNFLDIPTDCPQRDERLGWTGDAEIFSATACFHMQSAVFFTKYLKDMCLEQADNSGAVPHVVPDVNSMAREMNAEPPCDFSADAWGEAGASAWGDAATVIPWNLYLFYGDKKLLEQQYDNMRLWTDFIVSVDEKYCGGRRLWTCGFHFGDWLALDAEGESRFGGTDKYFVASVYYMYSALLTARAAAVLGKADDAARYLKLSDEVRAAIRAAYISPEGMLKYDTQTAYVLGIHFHLFEGAEYENAAKQLTRLLEANHGHLTTGFVGTAYLCAALSEAGSSEKAYTLLLNEDYPGWLYEVNLGATTIWERWNSLLPDGKISSTGMNSLNHYAYGAIAEWIYRYACGLQPVEDAPGFQKIHFAPHTDERLTRMRASYESQYGTYEAGWERQGQTLVYTLTVPFGCEALVCLEKEYAAVKVNGAKTNFSDLQGRWLTYGTYQIEVM
ncbi:MAG: glycoside hydrolase family 78 protein [Lachnospiraceae bacterium]|nr:glycoside hydrolase family 78 protein [Lachnospiraceae bacterium]